MLITKEQQEAWVNAYIKENHTADECIGFVDGINKVLDVLGKSNVALIKEDNIDITLKSLWEIKDKDQFYFNSYGREMIENCVKKQFNIEKLTRKLTWVQWLEKSPQNGLNESSTSDAIKDLYKKINEIIENINPLTT